MVVLKRILVGVDGSENALRAVQMAAEIAKNEGAKVTLLNVIAPSESALFTGRMTRPLEDRTLGDERLHRAVEVVREKGVEFDTAVEFGNPAEVLLRYGSKDYDLIAIGRRGLSGVAEFLLGSVSSNVVHHSKIPT
ncbi:MAG TPA: universal stress protein, partial [Methanomassiliicoccales archaeon]|nr:universal stress protein [Methanomassiliicoccales archaeon]